MAIRAATRNIKEHCYHYRSDVNDTPLYHNIKDCILLILDQWMGNISNNNSKLPIETLNVDNTT